MKNELLNKYFESVILNILSVKVKCVSNINSNSSGVGLVVIKYRNIWPPSFFA